MASTSITLQRLDEALQQAKQEPVRVYHIDSRQSTPPVYPEHGPDEFEYWREKLETVSQSLEELDIDTPSNNYRMCIMNDQYWREESNHWKALFTDILMKTLSLDNSTWEKHHIEIDTKYWETISTLEWREIYRALDSDKFPQIIGHAESNLEDRRSTVSDIIYYKIAAEHWETLCKASSYDDSIDLEKYRTTIRSSRYWGAEFDGMSKALQKLMAEKRESAMRKRRAKPASQAMSRRRHERDHSRLVLSKTQQQIQRKCEFQDSLAKNQLVDPSAHTASSPGCHQTRTKGQRTMPSANFFESVHRKICFPEDTEAAEKIPSRRSKRIQSRTKNETFSRPQGIQRRGARKGKRP